MNTKVLKYKPCKNYTYKIYQIDITHAQKVLDGIINAKLKKFFPLHWLDHAVTSISLTEEGYKLVYEGSIESDKDVDWVLEELFRIFNIDHPSDFKGHSLSVTDLVVLNGNFYFCDDSDWKLFNVTA